MSVTPVMNMNIIDARELKLLLDYHSNGLHQDWFTVKMSWSAQQK